MQIIFYLLFLLLYCLYKFIIYFKFIRTFIRTHPPQKLTNPNDPSAQVLNDLFNSGSLDLKASIYTKKQHLPFYTQTTVNQSLPSRSKRKPLSVLNENTITVKHQMWNF